MRKLKNLALVLCLALVSICLTACGNNVELVLSTQDGILTAKRGETIQFLTEIKSSNEEDKSKTVTYEIVSGSNYGTITDAGLLTIKSDATPGEKIKVVSTLDKVRSNEVEIVVSRVPITDIQISAKKTDIVKGGYVDLSAIVTPADATDSYEWTILEGEANCEILGNKLMVKDDATNDATIKVKATNGSVSSNVLVFRVVATQVPMTAIEITSSKTEVLKGDYATLSATVTPSNTTDTYEWVVVRGSEYCTIVADRLTVKEDAPAGAQIEVQAVKGNTILSNTIAITVTTTRVELTGIAISADKASVVKGGYVTLTATVTPANTTDSYDWVVTHNAAFCEIVGNKLMVKENATTGSVIKVKATGNDVESNEISVTVEATSQEQLFLNFSNETINLDSKNTSQSQVLEVELYNGMGQEVNDKQIDFEITQGADLIEITPNGYVCSIGILGHGTAKITATVRGTDISETATVNVIVPPQAISIPELFEVNRVGYKYNYSKVDALPFEIEVVGTKVCQDYVVRFEKVGDPTATDVATYDKEEKEITFNTTGEIKVTVTSNSGSNQETSSVSYTFNVNNGINVETFEELKALLEGAGSTYNGEIINIVALNAADNYNIIPAIAKQAKSNEVLAQIQNGAASVYTKKGVTILGNNHTIDVSGLTNYTISEKNSLGLGDGQPSIMHILPEVGATITVNITDLAFKGNGSVNHSEHNAEDPIGIIRYGLVIGDNDNYGIVYATVKNVKVEKIGVGIRIHHTINSKFEGIEVNDVFSNGIESVANQNITFKDMKYGLCGAFGIEITGDECKNAGTTFDKDQTVNFEGYTIANNPNDGSTVYLSSYYGGLVPPLLQGNLQAYPPAAIDNICKDGKFIFISLLFNDFNDMSNPVINPTDVNYVNADMNGKINLSEITGTDTVHQFIEMDFLILGDAATMLGVPSGTPLGRVLLYNQNYAG